MPEYSPLRRWLPTLLGALLAIVTAAAYELGFVGPKDATDCGSAVDTDASPRRAQAQRKSVFDPRSRRRADDDDADREVIDEAGDDRLAALEAQNQLLAERAVTGELTYYGHSQAELEAMARHCDVRTDYPTRLDEQTMEDLDLGADEREAYQRALVAFADEEARVYRELLRELAPDLPELDTLPLIEVRKQLTRHIGRPRGADDRELRRAIAEERAGLRDPPEDRSALSTYNRYHRHRYDAGDRFAAALTREIGPERAEELRRAFSGWPGAHTREWGCPEDPLD